MWQNDSESERASASDRKQPEISRSIEYGWIIVKCHSHRYMRSHIVYTESKFGLRADHSDNIQNSRTTNKMETMWYCDSKRSCQYSTNTNKDAHFVRTSANVCVFLSTLAFLFWIFAQKFIIFCFSFLRMPCQSTFSFKNIPCCYLYDSLLLNELSEKKSFSFSLKFSLVIRIKW